MVDTQIQLCQGSYRAVIRERTFCYGTPYYRKPKEKKNVRLLFQLAHVQLIDLLYTVG